MTWVCLGLGQDDDLKAPQPVFPVLKAVWQSDVLAPRQLAVSDDDRGYIPRYKGPSPLVVEGGFFR